MAWPATRLTTYAPGSQVRSADLNQIQDTVIDHESRLDSVEAAKWTAFYNRVYLDNSAQDPYWAFSTLWGAWTWDYAAAEAANPGTGPNLWIPVPIVTGTIESIKWKFYAGHANGLANVVLHLWAFDIDVATATAVPSGASASSVSLATGFSTGQWQVATFTSNLPLTMDAETSYFMYVAGSNEVDGDFRVSAPLVQHSL